MALAKGVLSLLVLFSFISPLLAACACQKCVTNQATFESVMNSQGTWPAAITTVCFSAGNYTQIAPGGVAITKAQKWYGPQQNDATCSMNPSTCSRVNSAGSSANAVFTFPSGCNSGYMIIVQADFAKDGFAVIAPDKCNIISHNQQTPGVAHTIVVQNSVFLLSEGVGIQFAKGFLEFNYFGCYNCAGKKIDFVELKDRDHAPANNVVVQYNFFDKGTIGFHTTNIYTLSADRIIQFNTFHKQTLQGIKFDYLANYKIKGNLFLESSLKTYANVASAPMVASENTFAYVPSGSVDLGIIGSSSNFEFTDTCFLDDTSACLFTDTLTCNVTGSWYGTPHPLVPSQMLQFTGSPAATRPAFSDFGSLNTYYTSSYSPSFTPRISCPPSTINLTITTSPKFYVSGDSISFSYTSNLDVLFTSRGYVPTWLTSDQMTWRIQTNNQISPKVIGSGTLSSFAQSTSITTPDPGTTNSELNGGYRLYLVSKIGGFVERLRVASPVLCLFSASPVNNISIAFNPPLFTGDYVQVGSTVTIKIGNIMTTASVAIIKSNGMPPYQDSLGSGDNKTISLSVNDLINGVTAKVSVEATINCSQSNVTATSVSFRLNRPPTATPSTYVVDPMTSHSATCSYSVSDTASDPDSGDSIKFYGITFPIATPNGGQVSATAYTPPPNFIGDDIWTFNVTDQRGAAPVQTSITFRVNNSAVVYVLSALPVSNTYQISQTVTVQAAFAFDFTSISIDLIDSTNSSNITNVAIVVSGASTFANYTLPLSQIDHRPVWQLIFSGNLFSSGNSSSIPTILLDMNTFRVNRAPIAQPDSATVIGPDSQQINVLDNDSDPDGDTLSISSITQPPAGEGSAYSNGTTIYYTPSPTFPLGVTSVQYTVFDGYGGYQSNLVTVNVIGPTDPPTTPPTTAPTSTPSNPPTSPPTNLPTTLPTNPPTNPPTNAPTNPPTDQPTSAPTPAPTESTESCNVTATVRPRIGALWTTEGKVNQIYDITLNNTGYRAASNVVLTIGNMTNVTQYWNLEAQNSTSRFGVTLPFALAASSLFDSAGVVVTGDEVPYIIKTSCTVGSGGSLCPGLLVNSNIHSSMRHPDYLRLFNFSLTIQYIYIVELQLTSSTTGGSSVNEGETTSKTNKGAIIGGVLGGVLGAALLLGLVTYSM